MSETRDPLRVRFAESIDGMRVAVQSAPPGAASFSATYVGPSGTGFDPPGSEGTALLVNQLAASAAGAFDRVALARFLDRLGATLTHRVAPESGELTVWGPADEWERLLTVLADVVLRPRFDASDRARARRQLHERQLRETTQPAQRAERELWRSVFPERHPYRASGLGTPRSVGRIRRADLVRFHRTHYLAEGATLVITGPARLAAAERVARRLFGGLPNGRAPRFEMPALRPPAAVERRVDLPGRAQVEVRVGGPSIARSSAEYPAAALANEILGGRPLLSRLFQRVRERSGLAYHASSELQAMRYGGYWMAQAGTAPERASRVAGLLRTELDRLRKEPVRSRELDSTRESVIGEIPLALESTAEAHELAVDVAYHDLPEDFWSSWPGVLRRVRPSEVRAAAATAFDRAGSVTVLVGPLRGGGR